MEQTTAMTCPKCRGAMSSYERAGVVVDQCTECRGIFLDRGELERLLDIAGGAVQPVAQPQYASPPPDRSWRGAPPQSRGWEGGSRHDWDGDSDSDDRRHRSGGSHHRPKKRSSMLREFLDFG